MSDFETLPIGTNERLKRLERAAQQALEALEHHGGNLPWNAFVEVRKALRAALAQQAEPDHETRAELAEQQVVQLAEERDHYRNLWQKAQQANHLTIERLRDALVASRIIDPAAVEDPDGYDDGVTLHRIGALHWRLT